MNNFSILHLGKKAVLCCKTYLEVITTCHQFFYSMNVALQKYCTRKQQNNYQKMQQPTSYSECTTRQLLLVSTRLMLYDSNAFAVQNNTQSKECIPEGGATIIIFLFHIKFNHCAVAKNYIICSLIYVNSEYRMQ